ncbi:unnamed protein product [Nippostrongylus brasiliensis]|uniref:ADP/ATP translocase n=1 Tax=Nippostrongylus brasiliensis TaxID=27835 RepID=A0A0N4YM43_NIPBR|nr:unnamed protein product [Nippostrongylus brasiliensis]
MSHTDDGVLQSSGKLICDAVGGKYKSGWESMQYVTPCDRITSMDRVERTYCSGFFPGLYSIAISCTNKILIDALVTLMKHDQ